MKKQHYSVLFLPRNQERETSASKNSLNIYSNGRFFGCMISGRGRLRSQEYFYGMEVEGQQHGILPKNIFVYHRDR